jgi:4'-phosphopantetheinyl transferase
MPPEDGDLSALTPDEQVRFAASSKRQRTELLAGRRAVRALVQITKWCEWRGMETSECGRPRLRGCDNVDVSISHSQDWLLVAIATGRRVGVDVEVISAVFDQASLANRACTAEELELVRAVGHDERRRWMADLWTTKEAILKARGRGLMDDPRLVSISISEAKAIRVHAPAAELSVAIATLPWERELVHAA